jgi:hypothetical protein
MNEYADIFTPCVYFLTYFYSECTPNYACVKTGNLYMTNRANSCCELKLSGERTWDDGAKLNRWTLVIFIAVPCILKSKVSHSPTDALFITL